MIRPAWAAAIWSNATHLFIELPSPVTGARGHVVTVPHTTAGLARALSILHARAANPEASTLSTKGAPTQRQVSEQEVKVILRRPRKPKPIANPERAGRIRELLRREGMI